MGSYVEVIENLGFKKGFYYWTITDDGIKFLFKVLECHGNAFVVKEFLPGKGVKPVNLIGDTILMEMTHTQFSELYPEYII